MRVRARPCYSRVYFAKCDFLGGFKLGLFECNVLAVTVALKAVNEKLSAAKRSKEDALNDVIFQPTNVVNHAFISFFVQRFSGFF